MKKEIAEKWVTALRSGGYTQCIGKLKNSHNGHCCLGVLADVMRYKITDKGDEVINPDGSTGYEQFYKLGVPNGVLWTMNDEQNKSFSEIADYIDKNYDQF